MKILAIDIGSNSVKVGGFLTLEEGQEERTNPGPLDN